MAAEEEAHLAALRPGASGRGGAGGAPAREELVLQEGLGALDAELDDYAEGTLSPHSVKGGGGGGGGMLQGAGPSRQSGKHSAQPPQGAVTSRPRSMRTWATSGKKRAPPRVPVAAASGDSGGDFPGRSDPDEAYDGAGEEEAERRKPRRPSSGRWSGGGSARRSNGGAGSGRGGSAGSHRGAAAASAFGMAAAAAAVSSGAPSPACAEERIAPHPLASRITEGIEGGEQPQQQQAAHAGPAPPAVSTHLSPLGNGMTLGSNDDDEAGTFMSSSSAGNAFSNARVHPQPLGTAEGAD